MDRISWSQAGSAWGQEIEDGIPGGSGIFATLLVDKTCPGLLRGWSSGPCFSGHLRSGDVLPRFRSRFRRLRMFHNPAPPAAVPAGLFASGGNTTFMNGSAMPRPVEPAVYRHQRHQVRDYLRRVEPRARKGANHPGGRGLRGTGRKLFEEALLLLVILGPRRSCGRGCGRWRESLFPIAF
jgi:hypothetical protein